jgi:hypothetical protein
MVLSTRTGSVRNLDTTSKSIRGSTDILSALPSKLHRVILTLRPDPRAVLVEQPRNRQHRHRNESKQARCPPNTKPLIHLEREQRKYGTHRVSRNAIRGHRRSTVERSIRVNEVQRGAEEDAHVAPSERNTGEDGRDPVDVTASTPAEPEETDRHAETAHLSAEQPILRWYGSFPLLEHTLMVLGIVESVNQDICADGEENSQANCCEGQTVLPGIETIHRRKGKRVRREEGEENREREGSVQAEEKDGGLGEQHVQRSQQCDCQKHLHESQTFQCCLRRRWDVEAFCSSVQDDLLVCLGHAHDWDCDGQCDEDGAPLGPAPAFELSGESTDDRAQGRSKELLPH